jgi:predicted DNA-binding transcriptional regulator AlpA
LTPSLDQVLGVLRARADEVPQAQIVPVLVQLAAVQCALAARLAGGEGHEQSNRIQEDRLLTVTEAAQKLGVKTDWLYRESGRLPFTVRPSPGRVRFSVLGIERWVSQRRGR